MESKMEDLPPCVRCNHITYYVRNGRSVSSLNKDGVCRNCSDLETARGWYRMFSGCFTPFTYFLDCFRV